MIKPNDTQSMATEEYRNSVEALVRVAQSDTNASKAAAQVLLSAYNGNNFHVDVTDLGLLGTDNLAHALRVIWGRSVFPCMEPHKVISNGTAIFHGLWDDYYWLHVQNRWKSTCSDCNGRGWKWVDPDCAVDERKKPCQVCDGRGLKADVEWPGYDVK